ncbi:hypothetical protein IAR55_006338 [Kwoniella newhampshirensis]|uniref:Xylanolytic transcriptional activator regulatory domain-containing protein n=1 Tax=Kwoniella newhampshirensis TaxID=1651941 RepID=A0AAW0YV11_9TREE
MPPRTRVRSVQAVDEHQAREVDMTAESRSIVENEKSGESTDVAPAASSSGSATPREGNTIKGRDQPKAILAMFNDTESFEEEIDEMEEWHDSLDLQTNDLEESHFLGSSAMQDLTLLMDNSSSQSSVPKFPFRQVSEDPRTHVFFVKSPAFVYGKGMTVSHTIFERVCSMLGTGWPETLMQKFLQVTLPAFPILNTMRLLAACNSQREAGPLPHALLCGIMGHSIEYEPGVKHLFKSVWKDVVAAEDEEYKQPRLQTLQLAIISLATRPSQAHAVNAMSLARSVSIAHMIGLHLDCSDWRLPRWERSVRKRVWWALVIMDKWIAMVHGRPSLIHKINRSVPLPTIDDTDWGEFSSTQPEEDTVAENSMASFIGQCEISLIIEDMLDKFYSQDAQRRIGRATGEDLRSLSSELDGLQARIPDRLKWIPGIAPTGLVASGIHCFQLTFLGVRVLIARLYFTSYQEHSRVSGAEAQSIDVSLKICEDFVTFLEELRPDSDYKSFWLPHCSFLISTCLGLLLRIAVRIHIQQNRQREIAAQASIAGKLPRWHEYSLSLINRLVVNLLLAVDLHQWELAETAMIRGNDLLKSTATVLPALAELADGPARTASATAPGDAFPDFGQQLGDHSLFMGDWSWALNLGDGWNLGESTD